MDIKTCITCKESKNIYEFELRADTKKYRNQCKDCRQKYVNNYKKGRADGSIQIISIEITEDGMKQCNKCNNWKSLNNFKKRSDTNHGYRNECKDCLSEIMYKYYQDVYNKIRRDRKNTDIQYKLLCNHRNHIYKCLTKNTKTLSSIQYLQCTISNLKDWLQSQFTNEMTWTNYGTIWTVDHILPLSAFDLTNEKERLIAFNWKNLQPSTDNFVKSNKIRFNEFFSSIIIASRFITLKNLSSKEYQDINESLYWLRDILRYGKKLTDNDMVNYIISNNGQSAAKLLKPS